MEQCQTSETGDTDAERDDADDCDHGDPRDHPSFPWKERDETCQEADRQDDVRGTVQYLPFAVDVAVHPRYRSVENIGQATVPVYDKEKKG